MRPSSYPEFLPAGPPVVILLHPFGGSSRTWQEVVGQLGDDVRCVAPDLRGFGGAAGPGRPGAAYAVDDYADDVIDLVRATGLGRYVLVGHSMGGKVALAAAARRPEGLRGLVLVAPSPPTPEPMTDADRSRLLAAHGDAVAVLRVIEKIVAGPLPPAVLARTAHDYLRTAPAAWRAWLERGSREDIADTVCRVDVPVLIVGGSADPVIPPDVLAREVAGRLAGARSHTVAGAGHLLPLEAPEEVARLIREQVATCD